MFNGDGLMVRSGSDNEEVSVDEPEAQNVSISAANLLSNFVLWTVVPFVLLA
jgi:hypothetical protein